MGSFRTHGQTHTCVTIGSRTMARHLGQRERLAHLCYGQAAPRVCKAVLRFSVSTPGVRASKRYDERPRTTPAIWPLNAASIQFFHAPQTP